MVKASISIIPVQAAPTNGKIKKKGGVRIGYNYVFLKSFKESQKNDVVKCIYIRGWTDFGLCVVKEGTKGDTKDKHGRDIIDRLHWQQTLHKKLEGKIALPRFIDGFEANGNYYLAISYVRGKSLYRLIRKSKHDLYAAFNSYSRTARRFIDIIIQAAGLIEKLHENEIVHRDVTPANFMFNFWGKGAIIDMELSYDLTNPGAMPYELGTYGYMSPEQRAVMAPAKSHDIYSVGAILLQVATGIHPYKILERRFARLVPKVRFLVTDPILADLVLRCLHGDPEKRPTAAAVVQELTAYKKQLRLKSGGSRHSPVFMDAAGMREVVQKAIDCYADPILADPERGWFSENPSMAPNPDKSKINKSWFASFSHGCAGILYVLAQAKRAGFSVEAQAPHIHQALDTIYRRYISRMEVANPTLENGSTGIAVALNAANEHKLLSLEGERADWVNRLLHADSDKLPLAEGLAGIGTALLYCKDKVAVPDFDSRLQQLIQKISTHQLPDGSWLPPDATAKAKPSKGLYRGVAGIVRFLLAASQHDKTGLALQAALRGLSWLERAAVRKKGRIFWRSTTGHELGYALDDGNAGIALCFIDAHRLTGEKSYEQMASGTLRNLPLHFSDDNFSHRNGLTGLGEVYLEAARQFAAPEWIERAGWIAQLTAHMPKESYAGNLVWIVDSERQPVGDFTSGNSGVLHFLVRYLASDAIGLPVI